ncbi:uncharacterized protein PG986_003564 [Apiospora aurea]|uniref:Uncharacterized protein n=1 Tax=Apiospora aurea TaxID=335848 RepID=A0ABR1QS07_9PEZI
MVSSTGILDGHMRPAADGKRRWASKYRLVGIIVSVFLALWLGSCISHSIHHERRPDLRKRHAFDEPLGFNDSHALLRSRLWCMMKADQVQPGGVTASVLQETGWEEDDEVDINEADSWRKPLGQADGRLNTANEVVRWWTHRNDWKDGQGKTRRKTDGAFGNIVNGKDGRHARRGAPPTKWTDIAAVQWSQRAAADGGLTRIYRSSISYNPTQVLLDAALAKVGRGDWTELPDWPGVDFEPSGNLNKKPYRPETEAFLGLLASAHGAGPAYLLIQYRNIFGKKRIPKIKLWKSSVGPNMLLYVEGV